MSNWIDVAAVDEFPPGSCRVVNAEDAYIAVFNLDGRFYAIENNCTHEDADLSDGQVEGEEIVCPLHGARFSIITGIVMGPPAYENLRTFPVHVADGRVQVSTEAAPA